MSGKRFVLGAMVSATVLAGVASAVGVAGVGVRVPVCAVSQLSPVYVSSTGAAGSVDGEYGFESLSGRRCRLVGYPTVRMLTRPGAALSTTERHAARGAFGITAKPVSLDHGSVAYFGIHYAAATGFGNLKCPTSAALRLTAPGDATGLVLHGPGGRVRPFGGTTVHLHCGIVYVSPLTANRFQ
jgi:hypothetical protein